jgi:hypothetical protein
VVILERHSLPTTPTISLGAIAVANRYTSGWGARGPVRWLGSAPTLAAFGGEPGAEVTRVELKHALEARSASERSYVEFEFRAESGLASTWAESNPEQQAELAEAMLDSAQAGLQNLCAKPVLAPQPEAGSSERVPATGFAAAAVVRATPGAHGSSPRLVVQAIVVGFQRSDGVIVEADLPEAARADWERNANSVAWDTAMRRLMRIRSPVAERPDQPIGRADVWVHDDLDDLRPVLGNERVEQLKRLELEPLGDLSPEELGKRRAELEDGREFLDTDAAIEMLTLERRTAAADLRVQAAVEHEGLLALPRDDRPARDEQREAADATAAAVRLRDAEAGAEATRAAELTEAGLHPAQWVEQHGPATALRARIDRELPIRAAVEHANEVERLVAEPPPHFAAELGPAPDPRTREGARWDRLVRELASFEAHAADSPQSSVDRAELDRRIDAWRADRELPPRSQEAEHGAGPEATGAGVGI